MSMMIYVHDHDNESTKWVVMYNDTMDMKWKDAIKARVILKPLQPT